jgi:DNA-binding transcriptional LysR family regulator
MNERMELRHLRCFLALAEELHFGRAAQRLALSQPPLSVAIQQLEASIGARLFVRNSKSVQLTAAGHALLPQARALLERTQLAIQVARDAEQGVIGHLSVGFVGTMLYRGLPELLKQFRHTHPRLRLVLRELSSSEQWQEILQDRLDVGFVHATAVPLGLQHLLVARQPLVLCVPASHPMAKNHSEIALSMLRDEPLALVSREVSPDYHDRILHLCLQAGWQPAERYELRHWLSVVSLVSQGMGVALVPQALQRSGLSGVVFLPLQASTLPYETRCVWRDSNPNPALPALLSLCRSLYTPASSFIF